MFHVYELEFCESVAGGFAGYLRIERPTDDAPQAAPVSLILVQGEDWVSFEKRVRPLINLVEKTTSLNTYPVRINFRRVEAPAISSFLCDAWNPILEAMQNAFSTSRPISGLGKIPLGSEPETGFRFRWDSGRVIVTVGGISEGPKPELIAKLFDLMENDTPVSLDLQTSNPKTRHEFLRAVFEDMQRQEQGPPFAAW